jgi:hypothetical protein
MKPIGARGNVVRLGAMLETGKSRVLFKMRLLSFFCHFT